MMNEIFTALLFPSLAGSCLAAVILFVRPLTKKVFGYSWHYYIWLAVLITMLLPVRFSLPQKTDIAPPISQVVQSEQTVQMEQVQDTAMVTPSPQANPETSLLQMKANFIKNVIDNRMDIIVCIWFTGAVVLLMLSVISYVRLIAKMRKHSILVSCPELAAFTKRKVAVRVWENMSSPFLVGVVSPTLVLPARELTKQQLNNILRHEMTHLRRYDILYKWLTVLVKCLHWLNPMIWVVAKQINAECEISCDMMVTKSMSWDEKRNYIDTLLSLLPMGKTRQIPLTTQMASSKKILKRRFLMMKTKKVTSKFVSILSVVLALAMLSTTVFASGILSGLMADDTIEITNNGEVIELADKPFIENGEVYLPLRETFEKVGVMEHPESAMEWNDGKIDLTIAYDADNAYTTHVQPIPGQEMDTISFIYSYVLEIGKPSLADTNIVLINAEGQGVPNEQVMSNSPVLRGGHTYIPYSYMDYLLKDERWNIGYIIYDKDRNTVDFSGFNLEFPGEYSIKIPNRWVGKYVVRSTDGNTTLIQTATYDKYGEGSGTLFRIEKVSVDDADELLNTLAGSRLLYKGDEYAYIFVIPTDVQYPIWTDRDDEDIAIAAEYERMFADVGFIADSFTLLGGQ